MDSLFQVLDNRFLLSVELGFRIPIVSGILELYSGLQNSGFRIPQAKMSRMLDSEFPYMGHGSGLLEYVHLNAGYLREQFLVPCFISYLHQRFAKLPSNFMPA